MPHLSHHLELAAAPVVLFEALRAAYVDPRHAQAWGEIKGRAPAPRVTAEEAPHRLVLDVGAYDAVTGITHRGWTLTIELARTPNGSAVRIEYRWSVLLAVAALGAVRRQARDDLLSTVRLLLAAERASPPPAPFR
ncbi:MAG: hypothetical protein M3Y87_06895 [Myxococcota bacterium]|nr:hypothetical protein [Myxococcota bacterium]